MFPKSTSKAHCAKVHWANNKRSFNFEIHTTEPNDIVFLENSQVLCVQNIVKNDENQIFVLAKCILRDDYFVSPIKSSAIYSFLL